MTDLLLTELREHETLFSTLIHGPLCGRAAAEIERLRADKDVLRSQERNTSYEADIDHLTRVIKRLGSSETLTVPFAIDDSPTGKELQARLQFARDAISTSDGEKS